MVVWGDLLFLINFSMDFLCFYISCLLLHKKLPTLRACISSVIGGVYSVASLFIATNKILALALDIAVLIGMCLIVYAKKGLPFRHLMKAIFLYFVVSALLGGAMTALFSLFNGLEIFADELGVSEGIDVWVFALLAILGSIFTVGGGRIFRSSASKRTVRVTIESERGQARLLALVDSGNLAIEPISGRAVIFAELEKCKDALDEELYSALSCGIGIDDMPLSCAAKIRLVPTKTIEGNALLPAVRFKSIMLILGKSKRELDAYVAFIRGKISDDYDAIVSSEAIGDRYVKEK